MGRALEVPMPLDCNVKWYAVTFRIAACAFVINCWAEGAVVLALPPLQAIRSRARARMPQKPESVFARKGCFLRIKFPPPVKCAFFKTCQNRFCLLLSNVSKLKVCNPLCLPFSNAVNLLL